MRLNRRTLSSVAFIALLTVLTLKAQDFQIRTRVDLVVVPVTVKSSGDHLVSGLVKDDFSIFEDHRQQEITNFTIDPVPISAAVLVDTGLSANSFSKIQKTLPALTGAFSPFDEVAMYRFDTYVTKLVDFTKDKDGLQTALNKLKEIDPVNPAVPSGPFNTPGPVINGTPVAPSMQGGARLPPKGAKVLHDAIFTAANDLAGRPKERRRIVLVVTDGRASGNDHSYDQTLARLLDQNIQVYGIGMDTAFLSRRLSVLNDYTKATGGDVFFLNSTSALENGYTKAAEEARNQYVLGYVSNHESVGPLPIYREIAVKVDRPGVTVLNRQGYYQYP